VVRVDSFELQERLGARPSLPRWIIGTNTRRAEAHAAAAGRLAGGKSGKITPRAVMEPVLLAGTTVRHATAAQRGADRDAPTEKPGVHTDIRIGDAILVEKAGR